MDGTVEPVPEPGVSDSLIESIREMTWWMFDNTCIGMGAYRQFDYTLRGDLGHDLESRVGECYMLAAQAFQGWEKFAVSYRWANAEGDAADRLPAPNLLVHGWMRHPEEPKGIHHAWVILENGQVWEPITGLICDANLFYRFGNCRDFKRYTEHEARVKMLRTQHYGPWE